MSDHLDYIYKQVSKPFRKLKVEISRVKDLKQLPYVDCITREVNLAQDNPRVRRIFIEAKDSKTYARLGWVLSDDASCCMVCNLHFEGSLYDRTKYHCHACGNISCAKCTNKFAKISELNLDQYFRVCKICYTGQETIEIKLSQSIFKYIVAAVIVPKVECDDDSGDNASGDNATTVNEVVWYRVKGSSTISTLDDNGGIDSVFSQVDDEVDNDEHFCNHDDAVDVVDADEVNTDNVEVDNDEQIYIHDDAVNVVDADEVNTDNDEVDEEIDNTLDNIDDEEELVEDLEDEEEEDNVVVASSTVDHMHRPETSDNDSTRTFIDRKLITILSLLSIVFCILVGRLFIPPHLIARNNINSNKAQLPVAQINTTSQKPVTLPLITTTVTIAPNFNTNRKSNYLLTEIWRFVTNLIKRKQ